MEPTLVTFSKPWDRYVPGDVLFVDAATLAELQADGVIEAATAGEAE
jgi:hypothetical protein